MVNHTKYTVQLKMSGCGIEVIMEPASQTWISSFLKGY